MAPIVWLSSLLAFIRTFFIERSRAGLGRAVVCRRPGPDAARVGLRAPRVRVTSPLAFVLAGLAVDGVGLGDRSRRVSPGLGPFQQVVRGAKGPKC